MDAYIPFDSAHNGSPRRYRVTREGALHVQYLSTLGWREAVNLNTRDLARRVREGSR